LSLSSISKESNIANINLDAKNCKKENEDKKDYGMKLILVTKDIPQVNPYNF